MGLPWITVNLGRSGLKVSRACLGAMNFGTSNDAPCGEAESQRIIDAFVDAGHNFIDTANGYTGGQSEQILGRAVAGRRHSVVIATKAWVRQGPGPNDLGDVAATFDECSRRQSEATGHRLHRPLPDACLGQYDADRGDHGNARRVRACRQGALHRLFQLHRQPDRGSTMGRVAPERHALHQPAAALFPAVPGDRGRCAAGMPAARAWHVDLQSARGRHVERQVPAG